MKLFKRIIALAMCAVLVCAVSGVYAQPLFNASVSLNSDVTYLSYNEDFDVTLSLKTGKNYFAGPFSAQVFYTNSLLKVASAELNKTGKLYSCAKTYSDAVLSKSMTDNAKQKFYPISWSDSNKSKNDFCNIVMVPNITDRTTSYDNLDENIAVLHLSSGSATGSGTVFVSADSVKSSANTGGETFLSALTDNGKISSVRYDYGSDVALDTSNAKLSFVVTDLGDVDNSKTVNSIDALMILQHVTEIKVQTGDALKRCDVNGDGTGNSADALAVLQIATGLLHLNDIYKK